jgi:phage portal protein BeeE
MDLERATFSNIEQQSISYVVDAIRPWAVRWEQAINQQLLNGSGMFFAEHSVDGLLRGDISSRYAAYAVGRQWGWLSINDIRGLENMNPIAKGGDVYLTPMNMVPAGTEPEEAPTDDEIDQAARTLRKLRLTRRA